MSQLHSPIDAIDSDASSDIGNINPPVLYKIGIIVFYIAIGLNFGNMSVLENVEAYRTLIAVLLAIGFILAFASRGPRVVPSNEYPYLALMLNIWIFYAGYLTVITFARSGNITATIYSGTTFYFMVMSMILAYRHVVAGYASNFFWIMLVVMAVLSTAINFYFARFQSVNFLDSEFAFIEDIRFQIISSSAMILTVVGFVNIIKSRQVFLSYILVSVMMFIYAIAKTRGVLLGLSALVVYLLLIHERRWAAAVRLFIPLAISLPFVFLLSLYIANFNLFEAWQIRFFNVDDSLSVETFYTRLAEYVAQINMLVSDVQSAVFGFGYLETMIWDPRIWDQLNPELDPTYYYMTRYIGQHSTWINSLFHGGFIFGLIPFFTITFPFLLAIWQVTLPSRERAKLDIHAIYACGIACMVWLPASFALMFGDRLGPAAFGPSLIYSVYGWEKFRNARRLARSEPQNHSMDIEILSGQTVR